MVLPVCKITGDDRGSFSGKGCLKRGRTDHVAQGLNLREKGCEIVDWGVERGRAAMAAFPTTETVDPMAK